MTSYQENRSIVIEGKIKQLESQMSFIKRNLVLVILFGLFFIPLAPFYGEDDMPILKNLDYNYLLALCFSAGVYLSFCFLAHFLWDYQDRRKIKSHHRK
ncbi:hypothetical protein [Aquimarina rhabdastrellae]